MLEFGGIIAVQTLIRGGEHVEIRKRILENLLVPAARVA